MKTTLIAAALIVAGSSFGVKADADGDACSLNRPFQVLNAQTGVREWNRVKGDRGWCVFSDQGIDNGTFASDGPSDISSSETPGAESPSGGETDSE